MEKTLRNLKRIKNNWKKSKKKNFNFFFNKTKAKNLNTFFINFIISIIIVMQMF